MKKIVFISIAALLVFSASVYYFVQVTKEKLTYVTFDINPSVQLALNEDEEVEEVLALNDDGDVIISDLELVGLTLDEATNLIIDSATETGYIDEFGEDNLVAVTAYSEDEEERTNIENKVIEKAKRVLDDRKIYSEVVSGLMTDELKAEAEEYDISNGKMLLVQKAYLLDETLDKEELVDLSVKEIQTKIKAVVDTRYEVKEMNKEQFKTYAEEQKEIRKQEAENRKEQIIEQIKEEERTRLEQVGKENQDELIKELIEEKKEEIRQRASQKPDDDNAQGNDNSNANRNN